MERPAGGDEAPRQAVAREGLIRLARALIVAFGVLPWIAPFARDHLGRAGALLDRVFGAMCHRLPDRTLAIADAPMPLCSRCAGILAGAALGAVLARPALPLARWPRLILMAGAIMAAEVLTQDLGWHHVWHPSRLLTGGLFGYVVTVATLAALRRDDPTTSTD